MMMLTEMTLFVQLSLHLAENSLPSKASNRTGGQGGHLADDHDHDHRHAGDRHYAGDDHHMDHDHDLDEDVDVLLYCGCHRMRATPTMQVRIMLTLSRHWTQVKGM